MCTSITLKTRPILIEWMLSKHDLQSLRPSAEVPNIINIENSRKTAEKGAEWVTVKQPKTAGRTAETTEKQSKVLKTTVFRVFRLFFRPFFGCFTMTHSAPFGLFSGCFQCRAFGTRSSVDGRRDCKTWSLGRFACLSTKGRRQTGFSTNTS